LKMFWKSSKPLRLLINWLKAWPLSLKHTLSIKGWIYVILFLLGPVISGALIGVKMFTNYLPTGDDPGNWLKRINAFLGNTYTLWNEGLVSYPPLFHMVGAFLTLFSGDPVVAMKVSALLSLMLIPITSGWFAYKISGSRQLSVITSLVVSADGYYDALIKRERASTNIQSRRRKKPDHLGDTLFCSGTITIEQQ